uniref:DUF927 domain-containing protein n=1 Tax=Paracoccus sp. TRP TaxID=412597 RepID=UPI000225F231|nr:DUF927 domain-containing protein [Paracoccus sp. TRP]
MPDHDVSPMPEHRAPQSDLETADPALADAALAVPASNAGQAQLPAPVATATYVATADAASPIDPQIRAFLLAMLEEMPPGWHYLARERMLGFGGREDDDWTPMCGPLRVESLVRDGHGRNWSRRIRFLDRDGILRHVTIAEEEMIAGPRRVCAQLVAAGLAIEGNRDYIVDMLRRWPVRARTRLVSQPGWQQAGDTPVFVLPDGSVLGRPGPHEDAIELSITRPAAPPCGSLEGWKDSIGQLALGNPAIICAISAALTGPLLKFAGIDTLGLNFHARTSSGKTTALVAALSCMAPREALATWNATNTGLELTCLQANDGALLLDEFPAQPSTEIIAALYSTGNGTGRLRGNRKLALEKTTHWRTAMLSTSERPIAAMLASARIDMPAGLGVRLIDIPARSWTHGIFENLHGYASGHALSEAIRDAAGRHHGHALPAFVQRLIEHHAIIATTVPALIERLQPDMLAAVGLTVESPDGPVQRVLKRLALIAATGEIAARLGVLPWPQNTASVALTEIARLWHRAHAAQPPTSAEAMAHRLTGWLRANRHRLLRPGAVLGDNDVGWIDMNWIYLGAEALRTEVASGMQAERAVKLLREAGILVPGGERVSSQYKLPRSIDPDRNRAYRLDRSMLEMG